MSCSPSLLVGTLRSSDGGSGDSGFSSATGGTSGMRRACSLSDLTNPAAPRRVLPTPPSGRYSMSGLGLEEQCRVEHFVLFAIVVLSPGHSMINGLVD